MTPARPATTAKNTREDQHTVTVDDIASFYSGNPGLVAALGALVGVAVLLVTATRLRKMKEHRATLLVANMLTIIAAALATMVSASGMWKFFTDILGETPLRIAFFAFIEIALFASALLARSRLLRDPATRTTGIDGIAVWVLAALTASLSALDSDSFREACLRLVAPLVAAWMWERALAAERNVRLGNTSRRINWAVTPERVFVWLRLAEAANRDVSEVDRARRRAKLGRARLHLHLLQSNKAFAWRIRRAHRTVIRYAMAAAEHIGLADLPDATNEREAIQMYMATLYGFVEATSPQAVAHLNAWQRESDTTKRATGLTVPAAALDTNGAQVGLTTNRINGATVLSSTAPTSKTPPDDTDHSKTPGQAERANDWHASTDAVAWPIITPDTDDERDLLGRCEPDPARLGMDRDGPPFPTVGPPADPVNGTDEPPPDHETGDADQADDEADLTAVVVMRRLWDREVNSGRVPTGAELSRAAGVPPTTGLGRRKRRQWEAELPEHLKTAAGTTRQ